MKNEKRAVKYVKDDNKATKDSIRKAKPKKVGIPLVKYMTQADADMLYMHEKGINSLIEEMYNTIKDDETIDSILDFLVRKGLPRTNYYRWKAQYPQLAESHDLFNSIIGNRLFKRINTDIKTIHHVMPNYDEHVWKKMVEYHSDLKKSEQSEAQKVGIVLPCYNSCCVKLEDKD